MNKYLCDLVKIECEKGSLNIVRRVSVNADNVRDAIDRLLLEVVATANDSESNMIVLDASDSLGYGKVAIRLGETTLTYELDIC